MSDALGKGTLPGQVEAVRAKLKRLSQRGWLHRTPAGRYAPLTGPLEDSLTVLGIFPAP